MFSHFTEITNDLKQSIVKNQNIKIFLGNNFTVNESIKLPQDVPSHLSETIKLLPINLLNQEKKEEQEKEKQEYSFELQKEKYNREKLEIINQFQKEKGLQTKECRKAILLYLLTDYNQMEKQICYTSNKRLLERFKEFCIDVNERTLQRDLQELREEDFIELKLDRYQNEYCQVKTARTIKIKDSTNEVNTFCHIDNNLNSFKEIFNKISNKLIHAKKYLLDNIERISKYYELKNKEKKHKGKPIDIHEVVEFFIAELQKPAIKAIDFFNWYSKRNWLDSGGNEINSWRGIAKNWC